MNLYDTLFSSALTEQGGGGSSETVIYEGILETTENKGGYVGFVELAQVISENELPSKLTFVFNGETYEIPRIGEDAIYGELGGTSGPLFDTYPILVAFASIEETYDALGIFTETAVNTNIKVSADLSGGDDGDDSVLLESLDVTANGDYYANEGMGWDEVHVAVVPSVSMGNLKLTNQTGLMLYAESFSVTDGILVSSTDKPIIISNNSTKNVAVPSASAVTAYISFDLIIKCAKSTDDISNLVCAVTAPSSSVPRSVFSATVHGTYRPSDPADTNMRAVVRFYGFIPDEAVPEMSVTLTLS